MAKAPNETIIVRTFELAAERCEDPVPLIYARLFETHPELEELFVMDTDGGVRGSMVESSIDYILDFVGENKMAKFLIPAARSDHEGYGVEGDMFDEFFIAMRDVFEQLAGADWTAEMASEWGKLLEAIKGVG